MLNPDCGFATFADNPITAFKIARAKLASLVEASRLLRERFSKSIIDHSIVQEHP
jgi:5-methyltetrahydropteroyltriglutamate--homocysteine methyltransferase